jgi:hypothetical protein
MFGRFDSTAAAFRHRVNGLRGEVHQNLVNLHRIDSPPAKALTGNEAEVDVFANQAGKRLGNRAITLLRSATPRGRGCFRLKASNCPGQLLGRGVRREGSPGSWRPGESLE